jgi:hypothetical protein
MAYAVEWEAEAEQDLSRLPPLLASHVLDQVDLLVQDPVRLSRPSRFPYRPAQAYSFAHQYEGVTYYVTVLFSYRSDERTIVLDRIGCMPAPPRT